MNKDDANSKRSELELLLSLEQREFYEKATKKIKNFIEHENKYSASTYEER